MKEETIGKIIRVAVGWNRREIESKEAMHKIWKILDEDGEGQLWKVWNEAIGCSDDETH